MLRTSERLYLKVLPLLFRSIDRHRRRRPYPQVLGSMGGMAIPTRFAVVLLDVAGVLLGADLGIVLVGLGIVAS